MESAISIAVSKMLLGVKAENKLTDIELSKILRCTRPTLYNYYDAKSKIKLEKIFYLIQSELPNSHSLNEFLRGLNDSNNR